FLKAWHPVKAKEVWEVPLRCRMDTSRFDRRYGGVMTTGRGLVFQGGIDGHLRAFDASTGEELHSVDVGTSMVAAPMTYKIDSVQYVAVMAGVNADQQTNADYLYGNKGRIVAFRLDGGPVPHRPVLDRREKLVPAVDRSAHPRQVVEQGRELFYTYCAGCHDGGRAPSLLPLKVRVADEFETILMSGSRQENGMPSFKGVLSDAQTASILTYLKATTDPNGAKAGK